MANRVSRREFIAGSAAAGAFLLAPATHVLGANERVRIAVIGCGGKGKDHVRAFGKIPDVEIVAVCDPDLKHMDEAAGDGEKKPDRRQDYRRVLDDKSIDAVVIATPNHWHAPMAILACQAGKHVYVEKPVSHSISEGRVMVKTARQTNRLVQGGTQHRSDPSLRELAADLKAGKYGKVLWVHCSKLESRQPIGKVAEPTPVPDSVDYDLWAGPAPMTPVMRKNFHYDWHWQWNWGDGETGNWGVHYIDDIMNFLDLDRVPTRVVAAGNRFEWDDDGESPNMHAALFDFGGLPVVVDIRNLADPVRPEGKRPGGKSGAVYLQMRGGNYICCEGGIIRFARGGGTSFDVKTGEQIKQYKGTGGSGHDSNFIDAIRAGKRDMLHAEIEVAHRSTVICHLANIAYRVGQEANFEQVRAAFSGHEDAVQTLADMAEQISGCGVDLSKTPFRVGPQLSFDPETERFTGEFAETANARLRYEYRGRYAQELPT